MAHTKPDAKRETERTLPGHFEQLCLAAVMILEDDAYGVRISEKIAELSGGPPPHLGSMYVTLARLEEKGCLRSRFEDPVPRGQRRARRFYRLERLGERALRDAVATAERVHQALGDPWRLGRWRPDPAH